MTELKEKLCPCCNNIKPISEFYKNKKQKSGYAVYCKDCDKAKGKARREKDPEKHRQQCKAAMERLEAKHNGNYMKNYHKRYHEEHREERNEKGREWYNENKERRNESQREYYNNNKDKISERTKKYQKEHPEVAKRSRFKNRIRIRAKSKEYRETHKEQQKQAQKEWGELNQEYLKEYRKQYYQEHKEEIYKRTREYRKKHNTYFNRLKRVRRKQDVLFNFKERVSSCIRKALFSKGYTKTTSAIEYLKCSIEDLHTYLLATLPEGEQVNTSNYHIDHICPCAQARDLDELIKLFHFSNLRLIPASENCSKSDSKTPEAEHMCRILLNREWID